MQSSAHAMRGTLSWRADAAWADISIPVCLRVAVGKPVEIDRQQERSEVLGGRAARGRQMGRPRLSLGANYERSRGSTTVWYGYRMANACSTLACGIFSCGSMQCGRHSLLTFSLPCPA